MSEYLNKSTKEIVMKLGCWVAWSRRMIDAEYRNSKKAKRSIKAMHNHAVKALDAVIEGLDEGQIKNCVRYIERSELAVLPQSDVRIDKEYYFVEAGAFRRLMDDVLSECAFCMKDEREVKRCGRRRDLIDCGAVAVGEKGCPFMP